MIRILLSLFLSPFRKKRHSYHKKQSKNSKKINVKNKQKGDKYELQIGSYFKKQGYKIYFNGLNEGVRDKGIDLVGYKNKEAILVQCKNWEYSQIKQEHLRIFLGDCTAYLEQNQKIFAKRKVRRIFVTSCKKLDYGVKMFIKENDIEYKIIPFDS